jgi:Conjugative transposon protein TcpC
VVRGAIPARPSHPRPPHPHPAEAPPGVEAFAVAFATEYLRIGTNPSDRARRLAPYVSSQLASNLEVVRDGSTPRQRVEFALPAAAVPTPVGSTVTVAARVAGSRSEDRWIWLAVPVASEDGALAVTDAPSVVPPPSRLGVPPPGTGGGDPGVDQRAQPVVDRFFSLYLGGGNPSDLAYLTVPGTDLPPAPPFARSVAITDVTATARGRTVLATVHLLARDASGIGWPLAYWVRLEDQGGRLEVAALSPAST